jgi:heme-degrading monooxygenase HmoA
MITEISLMKIDPEKSDAFEKMAAEITPTTLRKQKGYISDKLFRAIEHPEDYVLVVEWESVEAHKAFIKSEDYALMADPFGKFVISSTFAHYKTKVNS